MSYFIGDLRIKMSYFTEDLVISFAIDSFFKTNPLFLLGYTIIHPSLNIG